MRSQSRLEGISRHRRLTIGIVGLTVAAAAIVGTSIGGGGSLLKASSAGAASPDKIVYGQATGSNGYFEYIPGNGSTPTTQNLKGVAGSGCSSPAPKSGYPILALGALVYPSATGYTAGTGTAAAVGADSAKTGVCSVGASWAVDNVPTPATGSSKSGDEELDFSVGPNSLVAGRVFSEAQLNLQRSDKLGTSSTVTLIETLGGVEQARQTFTIPDASRPYVVDTNPSNPAVTATYVGSTGAAPGTIGFDTLEIQVPTPSESVSVVGPSSTFTLAGQICGGTSMTTTSGTDPTYGQISFTLNFLEPSNVCKSYTDFSATITPGQPLPGTATFNTFGTGTDHFTFTIHWGNFPDCTPDGSGGLPACPATQVNVNGGQFTSQTYCSAATMADPVCTTQKNFQYVDVSGTTETQVTENWDALIDLQFRGP